MMALGLLTTTEAVAQCRLGDRGAGYGYNNVYGNYGNSYGSLNINSRFNQSSNYGSGLRSHGIYSNQFRSPAGGLSFNGSLNSQFSCEYNGYGYNAYDNRPAYGGNQIYGNSAYGLNRQPTAYQHGDHIDAYTGRQRFHLTGRGY